MPRSLNVSVATGSRSVGLSLGCARPRPLPCNPSNEPRPQTNISQAAKSYVVIERSCEWSSLRSLPLVGSPGRSTLAGAFFCRPCGDSAVRSAVGQFSRSIGGHAWQACWEGEGVISVAVCKTQVQLLLLGPKSEQSAAATSAIRLFTLAVGVGRRSHRSRISFHRYSSAVRPPRGYRHAQLEPDQNWEVGRQSELSQQSQLFPES